MSENIMNINEHIVRSCQSENIMNIIEHIVTCRHVQQGSTLRTHLFVRDKK